MPNLIEVDYNPKNKRLQVKAPFYLNDVCRAFPSRRFEPKTKVWAVPLVKSNFDYLLELDRKYTVQYTEAAKQIVKQNEAMMEAPILVPFPRHVYRFEKSNAGFLPMEHQDKMLDHSWNLPGAAWFAKMGTGKTFAAIHMMCGRWLDDQIDGVIIICPDTLRRTWKKELAKYATVPYDFRLHETKANWLGPWYADRDPSTLKILAISVEGLGISTGMFDSACGFIVGRKILGICDESSRIKSPKAIRTKRTIELGAGCTQRLILNGTPISISIQDLWAQYEFVDPNILGMGDYWAYRTRYIDYGGFEGKQIIGYKNVDELMQKIRPFTVEVDKSVLRLPPKVLKERPVDATDEQKALFRQILKGIGPYPRIKCENVLERMLRLRQVVGGFRPYQVIKEQRDDEVVEVTELEPLKKNPKLDDLLEFIEDTKHGSKYIIWASFRPEIELIRDKLVEIYGADSVATYYGATGKEERSLIEDRYCNDHTLKFFIGNPTAAGLGLTLVSSQLDDIMYYYSGTSSFIYRAQSEDRAHRIGQESSVLVVDAVMENTVDEVIMASLAAKLDLEEFIFEQLRMGRSEIDLFGGGK